MKILCLSLMILSLTGVAQARLTSGDGSETKQSGSSGLVFKHLNCVYGKTEEKLSPGAAHSVCMKQLTRQDCVKGWMATSVTPAAADRNCTKELSAISDEFASLDACKSAGKDISACLDSAVDAVAKRLNIAKVTPPAARPKAVAKALISNFGTLRECVAEIKSYTLCLGTSQQAFEGRIGEFDTLGDCKRAGLLVPECLGTNTKPVAEMLKGLDTLSTCLKAGNEHKVCMDKNPQLAEAMEGLDSVGACVRAGNDFKVCAPSQVKTAEPQSKRGKPVVAEVPSI